MTEKRLGYNLEELKQMIADGWQMAHDPICSAGFDAAIYIINWYERVLDKHHINKESGEKDERP